jgi:sodium transport system ATP-binding protein
MIQARHLRKRFGSIDALRDISFTAADGCITGLLGQNGAGKTTTLLLTCGLVVPDGGTVAVGTDPHGDYRRRLGALLDHKGLYERLTAGENIAYFGRLHGLEGNALGARVDTVLEILGLEPIADRRIAGFSQGQRMKVALGRAIVHAPTHLVLDEPTNGLDIPSVHALRAVLRRMRDEGNSAFTATTPPLRPEDLKKMSDTDSKDTLVTAIKHSFDYCASGITGLEDAALSDEASMFGRQTGMSRANALLTIVTDWADHYSTAASYLRLNGILPPTVQPKKP